MRHTRRLLLTRLLTLPPAAWLGARTLAAEGDAGSVVLEPTPSCGEDPVPTPSQTAGPYYKPDAPERRDLRSDFGRGAPMTLAGHVVDTRCRPLPGVLVEIWHADDAGEYDNRGYRLRGRQRTDAQGRWAFETILTRHYARRTAHYHFRLVPPRGAPLVTQLYFPDEPRNARDGLFDPRLVMQLLPPGARRQGRFDFVLSA